MQKLHCWIGQQPIQEMRSHRWQVADLLVDGMAKMERNVSAISLGRLMLVLITGAAPRESKGEMHKERLPCSAAKKSRAINFPPLVGARKKAGG